LAAVEADLILASDQRIEAQGVVGHGYPVHQVDNAQCLARQSYIGPLKGQTTVITTQQPDSRLRVYSIPYLCFHQLDAMDDLAAQSNGLAGRILGERHRQAQQR
jgi:hypothetical protein